MLAIHNYGSDNNNNNSDRKKNLLQPRMIKWLDRGKREDDRDKSNYDRLVSTLAAIRKRAWKEKWPLVTEVLLKATGPWHLNLMNIIITPFGLGQQGSRCLQEAGLIG